VPTGPTAAPGRFSARRPRLSHEQQVVSSPGGFGSRPLPGFGCRKVFEAVRQDADHLGEGRHPALERVYAFLKDSHRGILVTLASLLCHRSTSVRQGDITPSPSPEHGRATCWQ